MRREGRGGGRAGGGAAGRAGGRAGGGGRGWGADAYRVVLEVAEDEGVEEDVLDQRDREPLLLHLALHQHVPVAVLVEDERARLQLVVLREHLRAEVGGEVVEPVLQRLRRPLVPGGQPAGRLPRRARRARRLAGDEVGRRDRLVGLDAQQRLLLELLEVHHLVAVPVDVRRRRRRLARRGLARVRRLALGLGRRRAVALGGRRVLCNGRRLPAPRPPRRRARRPRALPQSSGRRPASRSARRPPRKRST